MNGIKILPGIKTSEFENTQILLFINSYIYLLFFFFLHVTLQFCISNGCGNN